VIIWLTGLSASGKTTIGRHLYELWTVEEQNTVIVDGDEIRDILKSSTGNNAYTELGRHYIAERYCDLCVWLDRQGINVICCTISSFEELRERNRKTLSKYFEVYVKVPMETLYARDQKNLYAPALAGEVKNVVGVDMEFSPPRSPDMVVDNSQDLADLRPVALEILNRAREG